MNGTEDIARRVGAHLDPELVTELVKLSVTATQKMARRNWFRHGHHDTREMSAYMMPYVIHYYDEGDPETGLEPGNKVGSVYRATKDAYAHGYGERPSGPQRKYWGFEWAEELDRPVVDETGPIVGTSLGETLLVNNVDPAYEEIESELWLHQKLAELREIMSPKEYQRVIDRLYSLEKKRWQTPTVTREEVIA